MSRAIVGAHYGARDWLAQRVTAVVMALYTLLFLGVLWRAPRLDFQAWRLLFAPQWMKLATLVFLLSLCWHAWIGVRNIFMDYIKSDALRVVLHALAVIWLVACAGWSVQVLWSV